MHNKEKCSVCIFAWHDAVNKIEIIIFKKGDYKQDLLKLNILKS